MATNQLINLMISWVDSNSDRVNSICWLTLESNLIIFILCWALINDRETSNIHNFSILALFFLTIFVLFFRIFRYFRYLHLSEWELAYLIAWIVEWYWTNHHQFITRMGQHEEASAIIVVVEWIELEYIFNYF